MPINSTLIAVKACYSRNSLILMWPNCPSHQRVWVQRICTAILSFLLGLRCSVSSGWKTRGSPHGAFKIFKSIYSATTNCTKEYLTTLTSAHRFSSCRLSRRTITPINLGRGCINQPPSKLQRSLLGLEELLLIQAAWFWLTQFPSLESRRWWGHAYGTSLRQARSNDASMSGRFPLVSRYSSESYGDWWPGWSSARAGSFQNS
jgi:hypothetical protein